MELLLKMCAIAMIGIFAVSGLKKSIPEMSVAAMLATQIVLALTAAGAVGTVVNFIYRIAEMGGISGELIRPLIKTVGISIVTKITCDTCRDSGAASIAAYIEIVGSAIAVSFSMPLMMSILEQISL